jgi:hypothetical protein
MKKRLLILMVILLNAALISLPIGAQPETSETTQAQDLLIKSEVETAVSMLQAIFQKQEAT